MSASRSRFENACRLADYTARQLGQDAAKAHRLAILAHVQRLNKALDAKSGVEASIARREAGHFADALVRHLDEFCAP